MKWECNYSPNKFGKNLGHGLIDHRFCHTLFYMHIHMKKVRRPVVGKVGQFGTSMTIYFAVSCTPPLKGNNLALVGHKEDFF